MKLISVVSMALLFAAADAQAALPRFPNEHAGQIVFVADGNLWEVPSAGGVARRLTSDPGLVVYEAAPAGRRPISALQLRVSPLEPGEAYRRYEIELSLERPEE